MDDELKNQTEREESPAAEEPLSAEESVPDKSLEPLKAEISAEAVSNEEPPQGAQGPFADVHDAIHFDPQKIESVVAGREAERRRAREEESESAEKEPPVREEDLPSILEALLFASGTEPLSVRKLAHILPGVDGKIVRKALEKLSEEYSAKNRGIQLEEVAGGFQLLTNIVYYPHLRKLKRAPRPIRLSSASMQVLALVAWKQPIIKADVDAVRGTDCGQILRNLIELGLIEMTGRAEVIGRPFQYSTTQKFLEVFGLRSLEDLPHIEDLAIEG